MMETLEYVDLDDVLVVMVDLDDCVCELLGHVLVEEGKPGGQDAWLAQEEQLLNVSAYQVQEENLQLLVSTFDDPVERMQIARQVAVVG